MFEANIFSIDVLDKPFNNKEQTTTNISLSYKDSTHFQWPSRFKVEVGDQMSSSGKNINKDFFLKDHGSKARKLAIEDFINKLTDLIKKL